MAEERILIQKIEPECKFREKNTDTIAGEKKVWFKCCKFNKRTTCEEDDFIHCEKKELVGLSRQEAIKRMVLAMHNEDIRRNIKDIPCDYRNLAEAALTAIAPIIPQEDNNER